MEWKVVDAKQRLAEVVRRAAEEPQRLLNRGRLVAVVIGAETWREVAGWLERRKRGSIGEAFETLRRIVREDGYELAAPARKDRPQRGLGQDREDGLPG